MVLPMDPKRWSAVNRIFHAALEMPASHREGFVSMASEGDAELEQDVIRLLKADSQADSYLEVPLIPAGSDFDLLPGPFEPGEILKGRFRIERHVGQGGMGHVFEAFDLDLKVRVALKVIRPEIASNPAALEYFRREVRTARAITHVNVCRTYDLDRCSARADAQDSRELYFLTMEFLDGETLAARIRREGPLATAEAQTIARQIAAGLDSAHAAGVIHRDLKPANIMLVPGQGSGTAPRAVIMDFGLARRDPIAGGGSTISHGALAGTLAYMAPEQLDPGTPVSAATDVYAFGLILFEVVTGQRAYPSTNLLSGIAQRLSGSLPSAKALAPGVPEMWERAIEGCLQPEPGDRFQSAAEVIDVLEGQAALPAHRAKRRAASGRAQQPWWLRRRWSIAAVAAALVCVSLFAVRFRLYHQSSKSQVTPGAFVYLVPVRNQTGEKALDNLTELLQAGLSQSVQINLLDQGRVGDTLQLMTRPPDTAITDPIAREIAMRTGAVRVVIPTVTGSNGTYKLHVDIQQPDNTPTSYREHWPNDFPWRTSGPASATGTIPSELSSTIRNASDWIRYKAGESQNDIARLDTPPEEVTTNSWEALHDYTEALALYRAGYGESALARLHEAVELDPKFALAYGTMGDVLYSQSRQAEGYQAYQRSLELGAENRLTKREEDQIRGMRAVDTGEFELAVEAFRELAADYPHDPAAWTYPTIPLRMLGRDEEAIANLTRAMTLMPDAPFPPYAMAQELMIMGRMDEAWKWVEFSRAHGFGDDANENEGIYHYLRAEYPAAEASFRAMFQSTDAESRSTGCLLLADFYAETAQEPKVLEILTEGIREDAARKNPDGQSTKLLARAYFEANHRELSQALADEHEGYAMSQAPNHALTAEMALGAVRLNSNREFEAEIRRSLLEIQHTRSSDAVGRMSNLLRLLNEGELDLVDGRVEAGVAKLRSAALFEAPALRSEFLVQGLAIAAQSVAGPAARQFRIEAVAQATPLLKRQSAFVISYARFLPGVVSDTGGIAAQFQIQTIHQ